MGITIDEAINTLEHIKNNPTNDVDAQLLPEAIELFDTAIDTMRKYQQLQADYENRLKADLKAMLVELQLEIEESENCGKAFHLGLQMASNIIQQKINELPPVTPQEQRWIPVSERLPDTDDEVLCWYEYYHWSQKKVLPDYGLGLYLRETSSWFGEVSNGKDVRVIAWMPLPKPYKVESEGKE